MVRPSEVTMTNSNEPGISPRLRKLLEDAWNEREAFHDEYLSVEHLLLAMFNVEEWRSLRRRTLSHSESGRA